MQANAKALSDRLEGVTAEKDVLIEEYNKTHVAIEKYNRNIESLKAEIHEMRDVITSNTVPVNVVDSRRIGWFYFIYSSVIEYQIIYFLWI